jgi:hypothetical protein
MNWWLISCSAAIGLLLGFSSINGYTQGRERLLVFIFIVCEALVIAKFTVVKHFTNGFISGFLGAFLAVIVIPLSEYSFWAFLCNNPDIAMRLQSGPADTERARAFLAQMAPISAVLTGLTIGALSWFFVKVRP